ncbi:MAG: hypothetical protein KF789_14500 [Bdellovibrionaceae bacterium]|nr:hypothetical protein [Pseudobdellovibrionaceae bacterium]
MQTALENVRQQILQGRFSQKERLELMGSVDFFYKQILCETERRDSENVLRERWRSFEARFVRAFPARDLQGPLASCLYLRRFFHPPFAKKVLRTPEEPGERIARVFRSLKKSVRQEPGFSETERSLCVFGLKYLEVEALRPRQVRDQRALKTTWRKMFPHLKEKGLLRRVRGVDSKMKSDLFIFLSGLQEEAA